MCAVSMVGDYYTQRWNQQQLPGQLSVQLIGGGFGVSQGANVAFVTREEFEGLKKEVLEMKELLLRAKEYDEKNSQPHCEQEQKIALLRKVAEAVGVSLHEVFP